LPEIQRDSVTAVAEVAAKRLGSKLRALPVGDRLIRRNPFFYSRAMRMFETLEAASLEARVHWTERRLHTVLRAALSTSRYGRLVGSDQLSDWPILEKHVIRDDPTAFLGRGRRRGSRASTSGTTGTPLKLVRSLQSIAVEQAAIDRLALMKGVDLATAKVAVLRGDDVSTPTLGSQIWKDEISGRRRAFASNNLAENTLDAYHEALVSFEPDCLLAYPTVLESLSRLLEARGRELTIPLTLTSSEVLSKAARRLAERVINTEVVDYYGQAERVCFAYSVTAETYTFLPGYGFTELLPVAGEQGLFEVVATSLWNLTMPLVRYRTGDLVALPDSTSTADLEQISYGVRPAKGIVGRSGDVLVAPDGAQLVGIDHIPRDVANVLRMQVVQEAPDRIRFLILPKAGFGEDDRRRIHANVARKIPPTMTYSIEVVDALERAENGKTPLVIRRADVSG
jgi:phenylacetate-CoA ligase